MRGLYSHSREYRKIFLRSHFLHISQNLEGNYFGAYTCRACIRTRANTGKYSWGIIYVLVLCQGVVSWEGPEVSCKSLWECRWSGTPSGMLPGALRARRAQKTPVAGRQDRNREVHLIADPTPTWPTPNSLPLKHAQFRYVTLLRTFLVKNHSLQNHYMHEITIFELFRGLHYSSFFFFFGGGGGPRIKFHYSYSFPVPLTRRQLEEIIPPQWLSAIFCNDGYINLSFSNLKCNDFEKNGKRSTWVRISSGEVRVGSTWRGGGQKVYYVPRSSGKPNFWRNIPESF